MCPALSASLELSVRTLFSVLAALQQLLLGAGAAWKPVEVSRALEAPQRWLLAPIVNLGSLTLDAWHCVQKKNNSNASRLVFLGAWAK